MKRHPRTPMPRLLTSLVITTILIATQYPRLVGPINPEPVQAQPPAAGQVI
jgi:hypothetical protein